VSDRKICSIGIRITEDVTTHGFALNVNNDLRDFQFIRPCGLSGDIMTSLSEILERKVEIESLFQELTSFFSGIMGMDCKWEDEKWLDAQGGLAG
jgi:lipoyl(octanoyl) transferase